MGLHPFRDGDTFSTFRNITEGAVREIEALENDYVLKASPVELEQHYVSKVTVARLTLDAENHYIEAEKGTQIDVSHDFRRGVFGDERIVVKGTVLNIAIPFTGDPVLWRVRPSSYSLSGYPEIEVRDDVVVFSYRFPDDSPEPERLKSEIERTIRSLSDAVSNLARDVENHNRQAPQAVRTALERKLSKAKAASVRWRVWAFPSNTGLPQRLSSFRRRGVSRQYLVHRSRRRNSPPSQPLTSGNSSTSLAS